MLNIEKYKDRIKEYGSSNVYLSTHDGENEVSLSMHPEVIIDWLCEEYQESLLENKEKKFIRDLKKWYKFDAIKVSFPYIDLLVKKKSKDGSTRYVLVHSIPFFDGSSMFKGLVNSNLTVFPLERLGL